ncbi:uncharacterized protein LOC107217769 isoform X1 [Neodiprion lecontei]|uniref:Uncharacterized protein LOC107217769 isoform X1 n=2 Tax=Neodiprion lecontei TaxID=441921 RepID=A0ABM3GJA7_NEOLC|nr:uncharacterized protein LOC107217769 isoform X1 [Neodiprion lecontei]
MGCKANVCVTCADGRLKTGPAAIQICVEQHGEQKVEQLQKATDRIQKEIEEVTEREYELRNVGSIKTISLETVDAKVRRMPLALASGKLKRTTSTPQILESVNQSSHTTNLSPKMTNGVISARSTPTPVRFATNQTQKGLMQRFLATRGKIYKPKPVITDFSPLKTTPNNVNANPLSIKPFNMGLEIEIEPDDEPKKPPVRKGYVPVEEKIQKELNEMKERENELRLMRSQMLAKSQPNLLDIVNDSDSDIYDGTSSLRSGTSSNTLNEDEPEKEFKGKHKANPRRRSALIAQWENIIASKKEVSENGSEIDGNL